MVNKRFPLRTLYKLKANAPTKTMSRFKRITKAVINGSSYSSLVAAIASAKNTDQTKIRLISDVNLYNSNIHIHSRQNIVLDLAGHTITSCNDDGTVYLEGTLIILDSSTTKTGLIENTYSNGMGIYFYKSGRLKMLGGTIRGYCSLYSWDDFFSPEVTIDGGIIEGRHFGISFRNVENLKIKSGIVRGGVMAFNIWS